VKEVALAAVLVASSGGTTAAAPSPGSTIPDAVLVLEAPVTLPGRVPGAGPPRFVMMKGGRVFVGGSEDLYSVVLTRDEQKAIEKRVDALRKAGLLVPSIGFGGDASQRYRLRVLEDHPVDVVMTGDPAAASPATRPLADFVAELLGFDHRDLTLYTPDAYALSAAPGEMVGGCRPWDFSVRLADALAAPQRVAPAETERWPTGSAPAAVCDGGRRYVVTLRPLLPGEAP